MSGCCTECGGITLFGGKDGATIHSGSGAPTIEANNGDYYIDTDNWEIYGPYDSSTGWGSGTSLVGPQGPPGPAGNGIDNIAWTFNSEGGSQGDPGTTDTYTITYDDATTDTFTVYNGADGTDANSQYGNTLFVDIEFGNDSTGTRERFDLPYRTISAALTDSLAGDNIIVRAGTYAGTIVLEDDVDIHFEANTFLTGSITDNGDSVTSRVSGELKLAKNSNAISILGADSDITISLDYIDCNDTPVLVRPTIAGTCVFTLNVNSVFNLSSNYFTTVEKNSFVTINVKQSVKCKQSMSGLVGFDGVYIREDFTGRLEFNCPYFYIGNSISDASGCLYNESTNVVSNGKVFLNIDKFECDYDFATPDNKGVIFKGGATRMIVNIKEFTAKTRSSIKVYEDNSGSLVINNTNIFNETYPCVHYRSSQRVTIKNSVLKRGNGGDNKAVTVLAGVDASYGAIVGPDTSWKLEITRSKIIKDGGSEDPGATGSVVFKNTALDSTPIYLTWIEIEQIGNGSILAISSAGATVDDYYILATFGNIDNSGATINNLSSGGYSYDAAYKQFEDQR